MGGYKTGTLGRDEEDVRKRQHVHRYSWSQIKSGEMTCLVCGEKRTSKWLTNGKGTIPST